MGANEPEERMIQNLCWFLVVRELMTDDELGFSGKRSPTLELKNELTSPGGAFDVEIADLKARDQIRLDRYLNAPVDEARGRSLQDYLVDSEVDRFAERINSAGLALARSRWIEWIRLLNARKAPNLLSELEETTRIDTLTQFHHDVITKDGARYTAARGRLCFIALEHFERSSYIHTKRAAYHEVARLAKERGEEIEGIFSEFWCCRVVKRIETLGRYLDDPAAFHEYLQIAINGYMSYQRTRLSTTDPDITHDHNTGTVALDDSKPVADGDGVEYTPERSVEKYEEHKAFLLTLVDDMNKASKRNELQILIVLSKLFPLQSTDEASSKQTADTLEAWRTDSESLDRYLWEIGYDQDQVDRLRTLIIKGFEKRTAPIDAAFVDVLTSRTFDDLRTHWGKKVAHD